MRVKSIRFCFLLSLYLACFAGCKKKDSTDSNSGSFTLSFTVNGKYNGGLSYTGVNTSPVIKFSFSAAVQPADVNQKFSFTDNTNTATPFTLSLENNNSVVTIQPAQPLKGLANYVVAVSPDLVSATGGKLINPVTIKLTTAIDSTDKFTRLSDNDLLDLVQKQTFRYFWDFGHPVSGMARERNSSGDICTTGGTGFGVMAILTAINRNFITRSDGLARLTKLVAFLKNNCTHYHGAFAHWINGATGTTVPFSAKDDGADLVETSYLMEGLLCARQYFNTADVVEATLRKDINTLWNNVEWSWFRNNGQNVLYWHWSPNFYWDMNMPVQGWNEALITYVLAASAPTNPIPKIVYDNGWAKNGAIKNGNIYYGVQLPLGPPQGGPLFFEHYSFMGINPTHLSDAYANYATQTTAHAKINYNYCVANPKNYNGYSTVCWGLTASDDNVSGYAAHAPDNDVGVITPTAAISSLPYTPDESMNALHFFYYTLGDKIWGEYGFTDAFNLTNIWFADSYLAIDQGPEVVMIENYRSGLLWKLFMSCPEIKSGMKNLGFQSPDL